TKHLGSMALLASKQSQPNCYISQFQQSNVSLAMDKAAQYAQSQHGQDLAHGAALASHNKLYRHIAPYESRCPDFADPSLAIPFQTYRLPTLQGLTSQAYDVANSSVT